MLTATEVTMLIDAGVSVVIEPATALSASEFKLHNVHADGKGMAFVVDPIAEEIRAAFDSKQWRRETR